MKVAFFSLHFPLGRESHFSFFLHRGKRFFFSPTFHAKKKKRFSLGRGKCIEKNASFIIDQEKNNFFLNLFFSISTYRKMLRPYLTIR